MDQPTRVLLASASILAAASTCGTQVDIAASTSTGAAGGAAPITSAASTSTSATGTGGAATSTSTTSTSTTSTSTTSTSTTASSSGTGGTGGVAGDIRPCQGHVYQCGDGIDNDGDGLVDADDPECTGACDNSEGDYNVWVPEEYWTCFIDCYFDADTGAGNDDCHWSYTCDPHEVAPAYYPRSESGSNCAYDPQAAIPTTTATCADLYASQSPACTSYCGPLTPNGCDCFGCCELPAGTGNFVWLGSNNDTPSPFCTLAGALDPAQCHPCEPVPSCLNPCEPCELCLGKTSLPADCGEQICEGTQRCGLPGQPICPQGFYCITGCCQPTPN